MILDNLTINKVSILIASIVGSLSIGLTVICFFFMDNIIFGVCILVYVFLVTLCCIFFFIIVRRKLTLFSDELCNTIDKMVSGEMLPVMDKEKEGLFYKIHHRLFRLYEIMQAAQDNVTHEKSNLQELISDISHQVKTPITNLKMINATMLKNSITEKDYKDFLISSNKELDKLDFLMQALIKTSRLETGIIVLEMKMQPIYETLAMALGGILFMAEKKEINVNVSCAEDLQAYHDRKWTSEALFNIFDNAVKYTSAGGKIDIKVNSWEFYLVIEVRDTGRGIPESVQGSIYKRFFRGRDVHDTEGIGIGLYLTRQIIMRQGGYIKVKSKKGEGSIFSVYLPNHME